jgi:hypothetical protein
MKSLAKTKNVKVDKPEVGDRGSGYTRGVIM